MNAPAIAPKQRYKVLKAFAAKDGPDAPFERTVTTKEQLEVLKVGGGWVDFSILIGEARHPQKGPKYSVSEGLFSESTQLLS